jgi:hypothetical protein
VVGLSPGILVLAAEFIPQGRVADQHDVVVAAARDPRVLPRAASELEGAAELRQFRVFQDVLGKDLGSVGLCECVKSELLAAMLLSPSNRWARARC